MEDPHVHHPHIHIEDVVRDHRDREDCPGDEDGFEPDFSTQDDSGGNTPPPPPPPKTMPDPVE